MTGYVTEIQCALRTFRTRPGFTTVAVLALALGIGANGLVFSLVDAVALRPLPFADPEALVSIWTTHPEQGIDRARVSPPDFLDWQEAAESFERLAAYVPGDLVVTSGRAPERVATASVTGEFFRLLGRSPALGRTFTDAELQPGAAATVVLSTALWQQRFGKAPDVLGQTLETDGGELTIVGVMPAGFRFPDEALAWTPAPLISAEHFRGARFLSVLGRLAPDSNPNRARLEMAAIAERLGEQSPADHGHGIGLAPLREDLLGEVRPAMLLLLGTVGLLIFLLCTNVSSLLLAHGSARTGEIGLRSALGATRIDLVRSFLMESMLLGVCGGVLGLLLAFAGVQLFVSLAPADLPRLDQVGFDGRAIAFTFGLTLLSGLVAGLIPAVHGSGVDPKVFLDTLRGGTGRGGAWLASRRVQRSLAAASVAVTLALLVGAGLLLQSFLRLAGTDPGFDPDLTLTALVRLSPDRYPEPSQQVELLGSLLETLEDEPGVVAAGAVTNLPLSGTNMLFEFTREGGPPAASAQGVPQANYRAIAGDYFGAMGIPLLSGRVFGEREAAQSPPVVIVSRSLADRYFPGEDALGKGIRISYEPELTRGVVGVVGDVRSFGIGKPPEPEMYVPMVQNPWPFATLVLRTDVDPLDLVPALRSRTMRLAPDQPIDRIATLGSLVSSSMERPRFYGLVVGLFAGIAFLSSVLSITGLVAYSASRRTHEIGVRMSLGADRGRILVAFVGEGLASVAAGLVAGALLALALSPLLRNLLFGVAATDPWTYALTAAVLAVAALCGSFFPAFRASRIEPAEVLRQG